MENLALLSIQLDKSPELDRKEFKQFCASKTSLKEKLTCFNEGYDSFGSVLFDALSLFESKVFHSKN